jgi:hypothetical protein
MQRSIKDHIFELLCEFVDEQNDFVDEGHFGP